MRMRCSEPGQKQKKPQWNDIHAEHGTCNQELDVRIWEGRGWKL